MTGLMELYSISYAREPWAFLPTLLQMQAEHVTSEHSTLPRSNPVANQLVTFLVADQGVSFLGSSDRLLLFYHEEAESHTFVGTWTPCVRYHHPQ
jgi:hypothetical protein